MYYKTASSRAFNASKHFLHDQISWVNNQDTYMIRHKHGARYATTTARDAPLKAGNKQNAQTQNDA